MVRPHAIIPYLPSSRWYGLYVRALYEGAGEVEGIAAANAACGSCGFTAAREMTRALVMPGGGAHSETGSGREGIMLTLPVEGGVRSLKRLSPAELRLSLHGAWWRIHCGAINACYGGTPWFPHFYPAIESLLTPSSLQAGMPLADLTHPLHGVISRGLDIAANMEALQTLRSDGDTRGRIKAVALREAKEIRPEEAALGLLMRRGRDALLGLLAGVLGLVLLFACASSPARADDPQTPPRLETKVYTGYYHFVDEYGDTVRMTIIRDLYVYPPLKFKDKKQEEFYWRTVRDVRKTLPYAKLAFSTLCETYEYIQTIPDRKKREEHLKRLEHDIFEQYKPVMKNMTKNQGKVLLKLINRETDQSSYSIVKAFLGSFRAGFWQTFGRFFGMNMKAGFNPEKNKEDAIIDRIATLIEQGTL